MTTAEAAARPFTCATLRINLLAAACVAPIVPAWEEEFRGNMSALQQLKTGVAVSNFSGKKIIAITSTATPHCVPGGSPNG